VVEEIKENEMELSGNSNVKEIEPKQKQTERK